MKVFRGNFRNAPTVAAVFDEAGGGGDIEDINAPCNAPAKNPGANLSRVTWHIDFFQYEIAAKATKSINHASLAGRTEYFGVSGSGGLINGSTTPPASGISVQVRGQVRTTTITLLTHNLGYVPLFMVAYDGHSLPNGMIVQTQSSRGRMVSAFATSSIIGLREVAWSSQNTLAAVTRSYEVMCFRNPQAVPGSPLMALSGTRLVIGGGKVDTSKQYLRRTRSGESSFDFDRAPTTAFANGGVRVVTGGAVIDDELYDGSFAGPSYIPVGI